MSCVANNVMHNSALVLGDVLVADARIIVALPIIGIPLLRRGAEVK